MRGPDDVLHLHLVHAAVAQRTKEVAHVQDAHDAVEGLAVDGIPRVGRVHHGFEALFRRQVDRERDDLRPRDHHVLRLLVGEVEHLVEHLLLLLLDLAVRGRLGDEHPQLGLRVDVVVGTRGL